MQTPFARSLGSKKIAAIAILSLLTSEKARKIRPSTISTPSMQTENQKYSFEMGADEASPTLGGYSSMESFSITERRGVLLAFGKTKVYACLLRLQLRAARCDNHLGGAPCRSILLLSCSRYFSVRAARQPQTFILRARIRAR